MGIAPQGTLRRLDNEWEGRLAVPPTLEKAVRQGIKAIVLGMLYGVSWMAALSNTLVLVLSLLAGELNLAPLPTAIMGWAVIAYIHHRAGWPPFRSSTKST